MIQINPLQRYIDGGARAAITTPPSASLVFDLPGRAIWVKGVKLKGTDHTYTFSHDNYISLTNTPGSNESEDILIGINTALLKQAIDTTYGIVSATVNGLAPMFSSANKATAAAATTYNFLGIAGTTLKWYSLPWRNVRINAETTDKLGVNDTDPLIISQGTGISVTWDSSGKKIVITNTAPDVNHNTDSSVAQTRTVLNKDYPLILKGSADSTGIIAGVNFNESITYNPSTSRLLINSQRVVTVADVYVGATASATATSGLVPAATSAQRTYFLRGDGTWVTPQDYNTWRPIKVNSSEKLGSGTDTGAVDFVAGTGITLGWDATNKKITITNASPDQNHNTDRTGIKLAAVSGTKKTDSTLILANSGVGLSIAGGTNLIKIGDGTNYIEVPITINHGLSTKNMTINGTAYALYTSASSLPTFVAPGAYGTANYILATNSSGNGLTWVAKPTSNVTTTAIVGNSATATSQITAAQTNPYYNLLEGGAVTRSIRFVAGNGITISAATDGLITITNSKPDVNHDTHYVTTMYIGESNDTKSNVVATNPYLKLFDNDTRRSTLRFVAGNGITIGSDASGNITITNSKPDVNHDTHYTTTMFAGENNNTKANAVVTNPYLKLFDNDTRRSTLRFVAGTGITIASDANGNITVTNASPDVNHNTDENVRQVPKTDNTNRPLMMINGTTSAGELVTTSMFSTGIYANASSKMITANGFIKNGFDDTSVLLAGGGAKALDDFSLIGHNHDERYNKRTTYDWYYELNGTGPFCLGKFCLYDSTVTINIKAGNSVNNVGTLVINTWNKGTNGGQFFAYVHGDPNGDLTSRLKIYNHPNPDPCVEVYYNSGSYTKMFVHIQALNLMLHGNSNPTYPANYWDLGISSSIPSLAVNTNNVNMLLSSTSTWALSTTGNAATATNADKLDNVHLNGIFTDLSRPNNSNNISLTIGGITKSITLGSNAWNSNSYALADNVMTFTDETNYVNASLPQAAAIKAHTKYIEFWDGYTGGGWYNFKIGTLYANSGVQVLQNDAYVNVSLEGHNHDNLYSKLGHNHNDLYVTSVGVTDDNTNHPDQLRYVKNSTSTYFTVPYATEALRPKYVDNWNVGTTANKINFMTCAATAATGAPSAYTSGVSFMTSYVGFQLATYGGGTEPLYFRKILDNGSWWPWREIIHTGNWTSFINLTSLGAAPAHDHPYVPLSGNSTINGIITISPTNVSSWLKGLVLHDPGGGGSEASWIEWTSGSYPNGVRLIGAPDSKALYFWDTNAWQTVYHTGNLPAYPTKASWNYDDVYLKLSGGTMTGGNINWTTDSHGIYFYGNCGIEKWSGYGPTLVAEGNNANFWIRNGTDRTKNYLILHAGNSSVSKSGETLTVNIGGTSYSLTNTNTWRGIQDNLTSTSTSDSLSANLGRILNEKFNNYLVKTTYDYHKEFSAGGTNYIELGCFSLYDSMVGIDITLTTTLSWIGRLIISSQNINSSGGGSYEVNVRGDNSLSLHTLISVVRSGTYFRVYLNASGWKKLFCHIWCVAASASEIFLTVGSMPSSNVTINNPSGTFGGNVYASHFYESSDARLKHNIIPISQSIRKFLFNNDNRLYYGFIAQELETLHPELVDSSDEYKTVNYNSTICYCIAELENKVQKLEDEINKLKNK